MKVGISICASRGCIFFVRITLIAFAMAIVPAKGETMRVLFFGDSITAGYGLEEEESYPYLLQQKANQAGIAAQMVNAGLSGDTTSGGLRRVDWTLRRSVDVFFLALGGNDGLRGLPVSTMESNLRAIIAKVRENDPNTGIVLAGMAMPDSMGEQYSREYRAAFDRIAREEDVYFIPFLLDGVGGEPEYNLPDRIHPNAAGQQIIADHIWEVLEPILQSHRITEQQ